MIHVSHIELQQIKQQEQFNKIYMNRSKSSNQIQYSPISIQFFNCEEYNGDNVDECDDIYGKLYTQPDTIYECDLRLCEDNKNNRKNNRSKRKLIRGISQIQLSSGMGKDYPRELNYSRNICLGQRTLQNQTVLFKKQCITNSCWNNEIMHFPPFQINNNNNNKDKNKNNVHTKLHSPLSYSNGSNTFLKFQDLSSCLYHQQSTRQEQFKQKQRQKQKQQEKQIQKRQNKKQNTQKQKQKYKQSTDIDKLRYQINTLLLQKQNNWTKMLEYQIQIDRLTFQLDNLKQNERKYKNINHNPNTNIINLKVNDQHSNQNHDSMDLQISKYIEQIKTLKSNLTQEIQNKAAVIQQRDMLFSELSDALLKHDIEIYQWKIKVQHLTDQLHRIKLLNKEESRKICEIFPRIGMLEQQIKQFNEGYKEILDQFQVNNNKNAIEIQKKLLQNTRLQSQIEMLTESLYEKELQLNDVNGQVKQLNEIIKLRDRQLKDLKSLLQENCERFDKVNQENQEMRHFIVNQDQNLVVVIKQKNQKIDSLNLIISQLEAQRQRLKQKQKIDILASSRISNKKNQTNLSSLIQILHLKPTTNLPQICSTVANLMNNYSQILQMFNVPYPDNSNNSNSNQQYLIHDALVTQITQFRNHVSILVRKVKDIQRKNKAYGQQNRKLITLIKIGCREEIQGMEKLLNEQNQEILRYRVKLANLAYVNRQYK